MGTNDGHPLGEAVLPGIVGSPAAGRQGSCRPSRPKVNLARLPSMDFSLKRLAMVGIHGLRQDGDFGEACGDDGEDLLHVRFI